MARDRRLEDNHLFEIKEPECWREALAQSLSATSAVMPTIPRYAEYPWAAAVGNANPLKLDTVFDDRYFMASNEMNLTEHTSVGGGSRRVSPPEHKKGTQYIQM
ncbi:MAG: hypothetical protein MZV65_44345 [Chromatiales bacterium]|nr:hypothetical protein [Chromatiales bacterium]